MSSPKPSLRRALRAALLALTASSLVAGPASATWSIVLVNRRTGEVGLASATCLNGSLPELTAVLVAGKGAAAAQATVSPYSLRKDLEQGIADGLAPKQLMNVLIDQLSSHNKQYGIATFSGPAATWHGTGVCKSHPDRHGEVGPISYAIQGNILTGGKVVGQAEQALIETEGDVGQRLMAAMEAARQQGGDGRCSCEESDPCNGAACGAPPPGFDPDTDVSACIGFVYVARFGDENLPCDPSLGCANGDYYMRLNHTTETCDVDPMVFLHAQYAEWRASWVGRPDHVLSEVLATGDPIVGDGETRARVHVALRDIEGDPVTHGGHTFSLDVEGDRPPKTELDEVLDHGDGTYTLLLSSEKPGTEALQIECDDHVGLQVTFYPPLDVEILAPGTVTAGASGPADRDGWVRLPYTVHGGAAAAGQPFALLAGPEGAAAAPLPGSWAASGHLDEDGEYRGVLEVPAGSSPAWTLLRLTGGGEVALTRS